MVVLKTNHGDIKIDLDAENAPASVANFLQYVRDGHYDNTVFHRVIDGFMIQGGGMEPGMKQKATRAPVANEATNGLKNKKYTVAMARTSEPHSATAQFFINVADNDFLDFKGSERERMGLLRVRQGGRGPGRGRPHPQRGHGQQRLPPERAEGRRDHQQGRGSRELRKEERWGHAKPTLFLSDLHLSPDRPEALRAFHAFAAGPARDAAAVYMLGDIFDWWVGDDQIRIPFVADVVKSMRGFRMPVSRSTSAMAIAIS
jgi:peptidyl-prolyl cis-trans isomerase B (cyclophilin B)